MRIRLFPILFITACIALYSCQYNVESVLYGSSDCPPIEATYQMHIAEIIETHCEGCHSGNNPSGGLLLTNYDQVVAASGYSGLADRIQLPLSDPNVMPPNGGLSACDTEALLNWVDNGTPFE
ncbi:MAG: hypothetical protein MUP94_04240 [Flavobacteriales bacterium]|nr:hypothetical protein [Flavobacteriales bacterium]